MNVVWFMQKAINNKAVNRKLKEKKLAARRVFNNIIVNNLITLFSILVVLSPLILLRFFVYLILVICWWVACARDPFKNQFYICMTMKQVFSSFGLARAIHVNPPIYCVIISLLIVEIDGLIGKFLRFIERQFV